MTVTRPAPKTNKLGLTRTDYEGAATTLCPGCGHNAITAGIIQAAWEAGIEPHRVAKLSGIGCSSKTPAYFLSHSHGLNGVHGRMATMATGVHAANKNMLLLGVSGDGDTASIGLGGFCHMVRRNVPIVYIIENNGVYGLTKGQFSATADVGTTIKSGTANELMPIDPCIVALELGCNFVARSFSGDQKQLRPLIKAAFSHPGTAIIDVISPCVTFADHEGSTKSYANVKTAEEPLHGIDFVPYFEDVTVDYEPGTTREVQMPDGSYIYLRKLDSDYDPHDRERAVDVINQSRKKNQLATGLLYVDPDGGPFGDSDLHLTETPLARLSEEVLRPPKSVLDEVMEQLKTGKA